MWDFFGILHLWDPPKILHAIDTTATTDQRECVCFDKP